MSENVKPVLHTCTRCVLDTKDVPYLTFNSEGVCSCCQRYDYWYAHTPRGVEAEKILAQTVEQIKKEGAGKTYDCIVGLSGGVDSTYVAYQAKKHGLRPLAVHFDNGWNSELSVKNIENIISRLGFDLYTYVINWEEFRDLQLSYLKASVIDIEAITDHAIFGSLFRLAAKHKTKWILSGNNLSTEGILPYHWIWNKSDSTNIKDIHRQFGSVKLKTFPFTNFTSKWFHKKILKIRTFEILDLMPYIKKDVKALIQKELGWRDYGGKHYESIWTRFYQGYILPTKFGIDKRKAHVSSLICSGQMTREEALLELQKPMYDPEQYQIDKTFVLKKFGLSTAEFDALMTAPVRSHKDFRHQGMALYHRIPFLKPLKPLGDMVKGMRAKQK
ncbi:MAG: N-acetyl sugar amidotransferase [Verrucomicrobiales bacterium]|nr:N-acetyl sugar amidotransferase [Verrucomicrobiales bacterium]